MLPVVRGVFDAGRQLNQRAVLFIGNFAEQSGDERSSDASTLPARRHVHPKDLPNAVVEPRLDVPRESDDVAALFGDAVGRLYGRLAEHGA
jgi:hypothetical protein